MKRIFTTPILILTLLFAPVISQAADASAEELKAELEAMQKQFMAMQAKMQSQIEALQKKVDALESDQDKKIAATAKVPVTAPQAPMAPAPEKPKVDSKYNIKLYGKIKFDAIYDNANMGSNELIKYIPMGSGDHEHNQFSFTGREARLGLAISGPSYNDWNLAGTLETDFYGSAPSGGSGSLRIRRAFVDLKNETTNLKIGQDWIPLASQNPSTLNFGIMGYNGNLWGRVPQLTLQQQLGAGWEMYLTTFRFRNSEEAQGGLEVHMHRPWMGGKIGWSGEVFPTSKKAYIGLGGGVRSGHVENNEVDPQMAALEFKLPFCDYASINGEFYTGQGLGPEFYHSGGAYCDFGTEIDTEGGFIQLALTPGGAFKYNLGYGFDDPDDLKVGSRFFQKSTYLFGNFYYQLMENTSLGLEATRVKTTWPGKTESGTRIQSSFIFIF